MPSLTGRPEMRLRVGPLVVLALLGSTLCGLAATASASPQLIGVIFITPPRAGIGDAVEIALETSLDGAPRNMDLVNLSVGSRGLGFQNPTTGRYVAWYTIAAGDLASGDLVVHANWSLGSQSGEVGSVFVLNRSLPLEWEIRSRIIDEWALLPALAGGARIVVEARTYLNGTLTAHAAPTPTLFSVDGGLAFSANLQEVSEPITVTSVAPGVFRYEVQVPPSSGVSRWYYLTLYFPEAPESVVYFAAHPFAATVTLERVSTSAAIVRGWFGGTDPIEGASVTFGGFVGSGLTLSRATNVTISSNSMGYAEARIDFPTFGNGWAQVTARHEGSTFLGQLHFRGTDDEFRPSRPSPFAPLEVVLRSDPAAFEPGDFASVNYTVYRLGQPLAGESVTFVGAWMIGEVASHNNGSAFSQSWTTDSAGNVTLSFQLPADGNRGEFLRIKAIVADVSNATVDSFFPSVETFQLARKMPTQVNGNTLDNPIEIHADYVGERSLEGASASVLVVPGKVPSFQMLSGVYYATYASLDVSAKTITGNISLPPWMPAGEYTVLVALTTTGTASSRFEDTTVLSTTTVNLGAGHYVPPVRPPPVAGGDLLLFLILGAVLAAGVSLHVRRHRRRQQT